MKINSKGLINCRGLFSFLLVLLFLVAYAGFFSQNRHANEKLGNSLIVAMELERGNFLRSMLEENVDRLIEWELRNSLQEGIIQPSVLRERIANRLMWFFSEMRAEYGVEFFVRRNAGLLEVKEGLSESVLMELFAVNVINFGEGFFAECSFHGGLLKNKTVVGEISFEDSKTVFEIPVDYYIEAEVQK